MRKVLLSLCSVVLMAAALCPSVGSAAIVETSDVVVSQLKFTDGAVNGGGKFSRKFDRIFDQPGLLVMNAYQPGPDIVEPIKKGGRTFSLFTSGVQGDAAPSAVVNGNTITADLSSLFFGVSKGDHLQAWNIGGMATGLFNPDTLEFCLTWDHLFGKGRFGGEATFFVRGSVVPGVATAPVPLLTSVVVFATGLAMFMGLWRRKDIARRSQFATA